MNRAVLVDGTNIDGFLSKYNVITCKLRNSRIKSKQLGIMEMLLSNYDLDIIFIKNGPLSDVKGIVSFFVKKENWDEVQNRLKNIGYFNEFYFLDFDSIEQSNDTKIETINPLIWKGKKYSLKKLYIQDEKIYDTQSPHNREFKIVSFDGVEKQLTGYRGNGTEFGRRALPVEDARCLVNLSMPHNEKKIIEPFAGGGGIVYMYKYINPDIDITSIDIDETLKPGLEFYGSIHIVGSSANVHLSEKYDAIVTEVPFSDNATEQVINSFTNLYNNLTDKGIIVLMCGKNQSKEISDCFSRDLNSNLIFSRELNRKGTDVVIQIWTKNFELKKELNETIESVSKTF